MGVSAMHAARERELYLVLPILLTQFSGPAVLSFSTDKILQAARQTTVGSIVFGEVQIASNGNQGRQIMP